MYKQIKISQYKKRNEGIRKIIEEDPADAGILFYTSEPLHDYCLLSSFTLYPVIRITGEFPRVSTSFQRTDTSFCSPGSRAK